MISVLKYVESCVTQFLLIHQECNQFLAADVLRSRSRFKALDETGVIGLACRHEFPYRFYNLRHGERYKIIPILNDPHLHVYCLHSTGSPM